MVLPSKVGKQRGFGRGLLLTIVTLGIYGIYWHYKAHTELFEQYELGEKGMDDGVIFLIIGILFGPLLWVYQYKFVENVNALREELGMGEAISPLAFLLSVIIGWILLLIPVIWAFYKLQTGINEIWDAYDRGIEAGSTGQVEASAPV